jgi:hypothetical protein
MRVKWTFSIDYYRGEDVARPLSIGVQLSTPEEVENFADYLGAEIPGRNDPNHHSRGLRVELLEDDPRLHSVIQRIVSRYGWKPSKWFEIPLEERSHYFGIRKVREYSKKDLDGAAFLSLLADKSIANQRDGTAEQVDAEVYVAEADRLQSAKTQLGTLFPFQAYGVTESLGRQLQGAGLKGLSLEPVVFVPADQVKKPLLKLSSAFVAPRSLLPIVNETGHQIEANTKWPCYLDDGGYQPHEFKYRKTDFERFQAVDIAMSYERTGVTKARAYRWCLVSQRFRQIMAELKVLGASYSPVRFVETF